MPYRWFFWSVLVLALISNRWLLGAWMDDPLNRWGGPAFILWILIPLGCSFLKSTNPLSPAIQVTWWIIALLLLLAGEMGSLQVLKQIGLALLLTSVLPTWTTRILFLAAAASWTPAWGWFWNHQLGTPLDSLRAILVILAAGIIFFLLVRSAKSVPA